MLTGKLTGSKNCLRPDHHAAQCSRSQVFRRCRLTGYTDIMEVYINRLHRPEPAIREVPGEFAYYY